MIKIFVLLITFATSIAAIPAHADQVISTWKRFASCKVGNTNFDVSRKVGAQLKTNGYIDAMILEAASGKSVQLAPARIENATSAQFKISLPGYWPITELKPEQCELAKAALDFEPRISLADLVRMQVLVYFMYGDPRPWEDDTIKLPELIKRCEAIPVNITIVCDRSPNANGPLGCDNIEILDRQVPVKTPCF